MQDLVGQSIDLLEREEKVAESKFHDYSFVVFPMAKAYEGFLKKFFLDLGLISKRAFASRHFRIGKSLNPDLPMKFRDEEWLYDDLEELCGRVGVEPIARDMWQGWKRSRNLLFHYFPRHKNFIDLYQARDRVEGLVEVVKRAVECGLVDVKK